MGFATTPIHRRSRTSRTMNVAAKAAVYFIMPAP